MHGGVHQQTPRENEEKRSTLCVTHRRINDALFATVGVFKQKILTFYSKWDVCVQDISQL